MKGKKRVIDCLNELLADELTAADQYFAHSRMYQDWGYQKLYERVAHEREDELKHADELVRRILFLEGVPNVGKRNKMAIGKDVPAMLENDLKYELSVIKKLKSAIALCEEEKDYETRNMLRQNLAETEEDHTYWLEKQLGLIEKLGLQNYLQSAASDVASA